MSPVGLTDIFFGGLRGINLRRNQVNSDHVITSSEFQPPSGFDIIPQFSRAPASLQPLSSNSNPPRLSTTYTMDGLDEFEKTLAAEKAGRERSEQEIPRQKDKNHRHRRERSPRKSTEDEHRHKHRDPERHKHHKTRDADSDEEGHRQKRSRHAEEGDHKRHRHRRRHRDRDDDQGPGRAPATDYLEAPDPKEDLPLPDEEKPLSDQPLVRDSWMSAPSALDVDYIHRRKDRTPPPKKAPERVISKRELNSDVLSNLNRGKEVEDLDPGTFGQVNHKFGDYGSHWRRMKI